MVLSKNQRFKGVLAWFASNPVAANLLMLFILLSGMQSLNSIDQEVFPRFNPKQIDISALYPGVGAAEIEAAVCIPIEDAIHDVIGIKRFTSEIVEGECTIKVLVLPDVETEALINTFYGRIQSLPRLPKNIGKISVQLATRNNDDGVIWVALHGPVDAFSLQRYGEKIQTELEQIPGVRLVRNYYELAYEMLVEVSAVSLIQHHISIQFLSEAIKQASLDQSGGLIKSPSGEMQLRVKAKAEDVERLSNIVLRTQADGSRLLLKDVAKIQDGLAERLSEWHHNGETAQGWEIHTQHSAVKVAQSVKQQIAQLKTQLPQGLEIITWWDDSQAYHERVNALLEDALAGFVLVCVVLTLFLRLQVALWAAIGILTSVMGALWLMPLLDISLNMLSLFGFLLAMGILVDDAIIIGESVYTQQVAENKSKDAQAARKASLAATIRGVQSVALPVALSVSVALVAFLPGLFLPGWAGQLMQPICWVMILTLIFSLIEALLILPAHLVKPINPRDSRLERWREKLNSSLQHWIERVYRPFLRRSIEWHYLTLAIFVVLIVLCAAWVRSGHLRMSIQADVVKDSFWVSLKTPQDMPYKEIRLRAQQVEQAFFAVRDELDHKQQQASNENTSSVIAGLETIVWVEGAEFWTEFSPLGRQTIVVEDYIQAWRKRIGDLGRSQIDFLYKEGDVPYDIELTLGGDNADIVAKAGNELKALLSQYPGVYDIIDSAEPGKAEIHLALKPAAERLGMKLDALSNQVRQAYFGEEVQRFQRGRHEVKVMLRLPYVERQSISDLEALPIALPNGQMAPLITLANISLQPGVGKIIRQDRQRALNVQARVDSQKNDINEIYSQLEQTALPKLRQSYPTIQMRMGQERQDQKELMTRLGRNTLIALVLIYILIAVPFRSYLKPVIFLFSVPVAWCGAVIAHSLAGLPLSMESLVGMIAASGVVVNDSLVLLDYLKEHEDSELAIQDLIVDACTARFRPIFLAFLTNFAGFLPTLLERSEQAQFLIPMTLSLSAGLLFGMAASLILTPVFYGLLRS